jgi:hypothetical protein
MWKRISFMRVSDFADLQGIRRYRLLHEALALSEDEEYQLSTWNEGYFTK